jgi:hypothetical protein
VAAGFQRRGFDVDGPVEQSWRRNGAGDGHFAAILHLVDRPVEDIALLMKDLREWVIATKPVSAIPLPCGMSPAGASYASRKCCGDCRRLLGSVG